MKIMQKHVEEVANQLAAASRDLAAFGKDQKAMYETFAVAVEVIEKLTKNLEAVTESLAT
jgi:hypothetical protein